MADLSRNLMIALIPLVTSMPPALASEDTGVGENGIALPSSPAFSEDGGIPVAMNNIVRAETAKYFAEETILSGGNTFRHEREGIQLDNQTVIRSNFDLIYSYGVFDATECVTVTVPEYDHLQLVQIFDEDHVTLAVVYPGETKTVTLDQVNSGNHVYLFMRTQPPSYDEAGMKAMAERQDAVVVEARASKPYVSEDIYDPKSFNALRTELISRAPTEGIIHEGFITDISDIVEPHYQMINLAGWGGLPAEHAYYFAALPGDEGAAAGECASTTFQAPDLDYERGGYWSITIYDADGWVAGDPYRYNSSTAEPNDDGSFTIRFNCEGEANNLLAPEGWNILFRSYLPKSVESIVAFHEDFMTNHPIVTNQP